MAAPAPVAAPEPVAAPAAKPNPFNIGAAAKAHKPSPFAGVAGGAQHKPSPFAGSSSTPIHKPSPFAGAAAAAPVETAAPVEQAPAEEAAPAPVAGCYFDPSTNSYIDAVTGAVVSEEEFVQRYQAEQEQQQAELLHQQEMEARARIAAEKAAKSKALLRGVMYGVGALAVIGLCFLIFTMTGESQKDKDRAEMAHLTELVKKGADLGMSNVFDPSQLKRSKITVTPNMADAQLLLDNVIGKKGNRDNWQPAVHHVCVMAWLDDNIGDLAVKHMKDHVTSGYSDDKYKRMVVLLSGSDNPKMRERLKDLYQSIIKSNNKKIQKMSASVLDQMRRSMTMKDVDEMLGLLSDEKTAGDLAAAAYKVMVQIMKKAGPADKKVLVGKLLACQKKAPEGNLGRIYKLLARTGDPGVLEMMEKTLNEDKSKALSIVNAWADWDNDDAVPYLFKVWQDPNQHDKVKQTAHDSILRVLSVDRERDDAATLKLFEPLVADAKTPERRQFLVSAFKGLSNRPYVLQLLGRIKDDAQKKLDEVQSKFYAVEEEFLKMQAGDAGYEEKEKEYNQLEQTKKGEEAVIIAVEKAQEKILKRSKNAKPAGNKDDEDEE